MDTTALPPTPENSHPANRSPENRFPRPPNHRPPPPLPETRQLAAAPALVTRSPDQWIQKVPAIRTPTLPLPESRSPEKSMPSVEDLPTDRDDLALSPLPAVGVNRASRDEVRSVTKMEQGGVDRSSRVVPSFGRLSRREEMMTKAELGFRVLGVIFCLISFSVMASDKTQGWSGDSFDRYKEYRYCLAVTVIGFVYAGFQAFAQGYYLTTRKRLIQNPMVPCFDFTLDQDAALKHIRLSHTWRVESWVQIRMMIAGYHFSMQRSDDHGDMMLILAYLLMSASSSAATRTDYWVLNWGEDEFTKLASASIGMSFLAFVAFAFSALISGYNLCRRKV